MPKIKFKSTVAENLEPESKSIEYFAENFSANLSTKNGAVSLPGRLGLRISPKGKKTWFVAYRETSKSTLKKRNVGLYPTDSYTAACTLATDELSKIHLGTDVQTLMQQQADALTFDAIKDLYLEHHASGKKDGGYRDRLKLNNARLDGIRDMAAKDIKRRHVIEILDTVKKVAPVEANRYKAVLSKMFNFAIRRDLMPDDFANPAFNIDMPTKEKPKDRVYNKAELAQIWKAFDSMRSPLPDALRLIALTGQRLTEIIGLEWSEIDMEKRLIRLPEERTKGKRVHLVPMSKQVHRVLAGIESDGKYVFPSDTKYGRVVFNSKDYAAMRKASGVKDYDNHDMRTTMATALGDMGYGDEQIGRVLNHAGQSVTRRHYNHSAYLEEKTELLQAWADHLDKLTGNIRAVKKAV